MKINKTDLWNKKKKKHSKVKWKRSKLCLSDSRHLKQICAHIYELTSLG